MFQRIARKRPIVRLQMQNRGAWANGMGTSVSAITMERSFPTLTGDGWANIGVSDGADANSCLPPNETVAFGQTARTYQPKHYAVNTAEFCIRDILQGWQFRDFLTGVNRALDYITEVVWWRRFTLDYFANAGHHLTLNKTSGIQDSATVYNVSNLPTATLTQGVLDTIKMDLIREGGDNPSGMDEGTNEPVFTLITSAETSQQIIRNNPELRTDMRYAFMGKAEGSPLVAGIPTKRRNYGGWIHEIDPYPRRFIFAGGAYVEVAPFVSSATTKGNKWEQNPAYQTAPYEESIVWHKDTYQSLAVNTITEPAPGWKFDARTWMGEFSVRNILHATCNPDGTIIFFRALFADAAKPMVPQVGWTIIHARCGPALSLVDCYGISG